MLVTSLVEDATACGIGDMLRKQEAAKQVCMNEQRWGGGRNIDELNNSSDGAKVG